jgi:hypothetical protein
MRRPALFVKDDGGVMPNLNALLGRTIALTRPPSCADPPSSGAEIRRGSAARDTRISGAPIVSFA